MLWIRILHTFINKLQLCSLEKRHPHECALVPKKHNQFDKFVQTITDLRRYLPAAYYREGTRGKSDRRVPLKR